MFDTGYPTKRRGPHEAGLRTMRNQERWDPVNAKRVSNVIPFMTDLWSRPWNVRYDTEEVCGRCGVHRILAPSFLILLLFALWFLIFPMYLRHLTRLMRKLVGHIRIHCPIDATRKRRGRIATDFQDVRMR